MHRVLLASLMLLLSALPFAQAQGVRIAIAPPAARIEVVPAQPSPQHIWVPGYWQWHGGRHAWVAGHFMMPPAAGRTWVRARWVHEGGGWIFYDGHWSGGATQVVVRPAPPLRHLGVPPEPQPVVVRPAPRTVVVAPGPRRGGVGREHGPGRGPGWKRGPVGKPGRGRR